MNTEKLSIIIDVTGNWDSELSELQKELGETKSLSDIEIDVDTEDVGQAAAELKGLKQVARDLDGTDPSVEADVDVDKSQLKDLDWDIDDQTQTVFRKYVDADPDETDPQIGYVTRKILNTEDPEFNEDELGAIKRFVDPESIGDDDSIQTQTQKVLRRYVTESDGFDGIEIPDLEDASSSVSVEGTERALAEVQAVDSALDRLDDKSASASIQSVTSESGMPDDPASGTNNRFTNLVSDIDEQRGRLEQRALEASGVESQSLRSLQREADSLKSDFMDVADSGEMDSSWLGQFRERQENIVDRAEEIAGSGRTSGSLLTEGGFGGGEYDTLQSNIGSVQGAINQRASDYDFEDIEVDSQDTLDRMQSAIRSKGELSSEDIQTFRSELSEVRTELSAVQDQTGVNFNQPIEQVKDLDRQLESIEKGHPFRGLDGRTINVDIDVDDDELVDIEQAFGSMDGSEVDASLSDVDIDSFDEIEQNPFQVGEFSDVENPFGDMEVGRVDETDFVDETNIDTEGAVSSIRELNQAIEDSDTEKVNRLQSRLTNLFESDSRFNNVRRVLQRLDETTDSLPEGELINEVRSPTVTGAIDDESPLSPTEGDFLPTEDQINNRLDEFVDAVNDQDYDAVRSIGRELDGVFELSDTDYVDQQRLLGKLTPENLETLPEASKGIVEDVRSQIQDPVSGRDAVETTVRQRIALANQIESQLSDEEVRSQLQATGIDPDEEIERTRNLRTDLVESVSSGDTERLQSTLQESEGLKDISRQFDELQDVQSVLSGIDREYKAIRESTSSGTLTTEHDFEGLLQRTQSAKREVADLDRRITQGDFDVDERQFTDSIDTMMGSLEAFENKLRVGRYDRDQLNEIEAPNVGAITGLFGEELRRSGSEFGLTEDDQPTVSPTAINELLSGEVDTPTGRERDESGKFRSYDETRSMPEIVQEIEARFGGETVLAETDFADKEYTPDRQSRLGAFGEGPDIGPEADPREGIIGSVKRTIGRWTGNQRFRPEDFLQEGTSPDEALQIESGNMDEVFSFEDSDLQLEDIFESEGAFRSFVASPESDSGLQVDADEDWGGLSQYLKKGVGFPELREESDSLSDRFSDLDVNMSKFYDILARAVPQLLVFVGALPAAIAVLGGLAVAGASAAAALAGIGALSIAGLALSRGDGNIQEGLQDIFSDLQGTFVSAFEPLTGQFDDLGDDLLDDVEELINGVAAQMQGLTSMKGEMRGFGDFTVDFLVGLTGAIVTLAEAFAPLGEAFGSWVEDTSMLEALVNYTGEALPYIIAILDAVMSMMPTIMMFSQGLLHATAIVFNFWGAVWEVIGALGPLATWLGFGIGLLLSLVSTLLLAQTAFGLLASSGIAAAVASLWSYIVGVSAAIVQTWLWSASIGGAATSLYSQLIAGIGSSITALWGYISSMTAAQLATYGLAAAIAATGIGVLLVGVGLLASKFLDTSSSIDDATKSLKDFKSEQSGLDGMGDNPYDPLSTSANLTSSSSSSAGETKAAQSAQSSSSGGETQTTTSGDTTIVNDNRTSETNINTTEGNADEAHKQFKKSQFKQKNQSSVPYQ